jgi:predicted Zn finger-like uncharacterized protein
MIVSCPTCSSRYDLAEHRHSVAELTITCQNCGNRWREVPRQLQKYEIVDVPSRSVARVIDYTGDEPELDVQRLVEAAKSAQEQFAASRRARTKRLSGWASLCVFVTAPFMAAAFMPETVVSAAPITIKAYEKLGYSVNIYGLDIRRIEQEHKTINGARVLMIKGEISNATNDIRKIPWLRFGLSDGKQELYMWTLDTASRPLRPGETTSFVTRVAAAPELAKNLQIRFAHPDEISSIVKP